MSESSVHTADVASADPSSKVGKYRLLRHLATGGMAEIWVAEQVGPEGFNKELVIKRILPHLARDEQFTHMFLDEARLAAKLTHPNIGQIYELGEADGDYFIAMEFIEGLSLDELLGWTQAHAQAVPVDVAARVIADVLQALDFAHEFSDRDGTPLGIVHRDVSPSNVMVSKDGIVKLVDFGVAKAVAKKSKTQTGAVKGKFAYMAPEQIESEELDRRADIFAIGVVFYELLTGVKPFGDELQAVSRILGEDPVDPRELREEIPESFAQIILKALAKPIDARYATAHMMLLDIETALRMRNSYVGPREIAVMVRRAIGMPLTLRENPRANDSGLFAADRSSERVLASAAGADSDLGFLPTAALDTSEGLKPPAPRPDLDSSQEAESRDNSRLFLLGAASLAALVVLVGLIGLAFHFAGQETPSDLVRGELKQVVLGTDPVVLKGAEPEALRHDEGPLVIIETLPETRVYYREKLVGSTPLQTRLQPGSYKLEFAFADQRRTGSIKVDGERGPQRHRLFLDSLDEKAGTPEPVGTSDDAASGSKQGADGENGEGKGSGGNPFRKIKNGFKRLVN